MMNDFTKGNAAKQILMFSLPMLIGNIFQQLYSMVDSVVVGKYVSGEALASVGVAMNVLQFLLAVLIGLTTGSSVVLSQLYGAKQYDRIRRMVSTSVMFLAGFAVVIGVLGFSLAPAIMRLLNTDLDIRPDAILYMRILMCGMLFPIFYNMYTAYLRALGDSRGPLFILICCTVLNTGLDLLFVVAFHWDVMGVAVATVIAQSVSAILCFFYAKRYVPLLHITGLAFDRELFRAIVRYGAPAAVQLSVVSFANLTITRLINSFGKAAMAGTTAATRIDQLAIMPVSTVSMAISTFVGQNMGADQEERARKGFVKTLLAMAALAVCISGLLLAFGTDLVGMFLDPEDVGSEAILRVGTNYLNIMVVFYFLFAFLFGFNGFFRGAGDAVMAMVFPVSSLLLRTVSAYLLVWFADMGPEALAWSIPIGWGISAFASWIYYKKRLWVGKVVVHERAGALMHDDK